MLKFLGFPGASNVVKDVTFVKDHKERGCVGLSMQVILHGGLSFESCFFFVVVFFQPHQIMLIRIYLYSEEFSVQIALCRNITSLEELVGIGIGYYLLDLGCQKAT